MKADNGGRDVVTQPGKTQIEASRTAASFHGHNASTAMDDPRVAAAMQQYLDALEAGAAPQREAFLAEHADIAKQLGSCLDGLAIVHDAARSIKDVGGAEGPLTADELKLPLGDFRVLREIGRGGMGIVYEAVQLSLGRRVALKVLPLAAALDPKHLQRFKNEAQAAAALHHTNIVPVYAVGSEHGVHYYSMQLIDGYSLADLIEHLDANSDNSLSATEFSKFREPPGVTTALDKLFASWDTDGNSLLSLSEFALGFASFKKS